MIQGTLLLAYPDLPIVSILAKAFIVSSKERKSYPPNHVLPKNNVSISSDRGLCSLPAPFHRWMQSRGIFQNEMLPVPSSPCTGAQSLLP